MSGAFRCGAIAFGIEPEITIKLAQRHARIYEVAIAYHGRTYEEGKKIGIRDALKAFLVIWRYWLVRDIYSDGDASLTATPGFWTHWRRRPISTHGWPTRYGHPWARAFSNSGRALATSHGGFRHAGGAMSPAISTPNTSPACARDSRTVPTWKCGIAIWRSRRISRPSQASSIPWSASMWWNTSRTTGWLWQISRPRSRRGGRAIVLVPQGQSIFGTLDVVLGHHRRYSDDALRQKMEGAGLHVETILKFNRVTRPAWFLNGKILKKTTFGRFQVWLFDHLVWLWRRVDTLLPWPPISLIAVGRKPLR